MSVRMVNDRTSDRPSDATWITTPSTGDAKDGSAEGGPGVRGLGDGDGEGGAAGDPAMLGSGDGVRTGEGDVASIDDPAMLGSGDGDGAGESDGSGGRTLPGLDDGAGVADAAQAPTRNATRSAPVNEAAVLTLAPSLP
jgi:hypothetical protein